MKNKIYHIILAIIFLSYYSIKAQDPMGLYHMNTIPQSSHLNPAKLPRSDFFIALPDVNQNLKLDVAFKNLVQNNGDQWMLPIHKDYDFEKLRFATGKSLDIYEALDIELIGFGFRAGKNYLTFDTKIKNTVSLGIPYELLSILDNGFENGKKFHLSSLKVNAYSYLETTIGYSREITEQLSVGVNFKPLFGLVSASAIVNDFDIYTSNEYWEYNLDGTINITSPLDIEMDFDNSVFEANYSTEDIIDYFVGLPNKGFAVDFGADYKITNRWSASVALLNLGSIKWNKGGISYDIKGNYKFEGFEVAGMDDDFGAIIEELVEDITSSVTKEESVALAKTKLAPELYLGTQYDLTSYFNVALLSRSIFYKDNFRQDFNLSANYQPYSFLAVNVNYSLRPRGGNGLGTALMFFIGPLQIYTMAEYLSPVYADMYFNDKKTIMFPEMRNLSVKVGLNLVFNRHGYKDIPMLKGY